VHFDGLRFIVNLEGGLERVCSPDADGSDFIVESCGGYGWTPQGLAPPHTPDALSPTAREQKVQRS